MATSKEDASRKGQLPMIIKTDKAFKLAEQWVNNMTKLEEEDNPTKGKLEPRPPRLGVGATVPRESNFVHSNDPVERKLRAKLDKVKKNAVNKKADESGISAKDGISHQESDDDDDDELESRTQAFSKKRPPDFASSLKGNKKKQHK